MMIKFLIIKEFKQFFRNPFLPKLIVIFPIMIMLVIPWIMTMDIKNIRLAVVDTDGSSMSGKFIQKIDASGYFILEDVSANYNESIEQLMLNKVDAIIEIPDYFEEQLVMTGQSPMQISINAVNQIKGTLGSGYINAVCGDFYTENLSYLYKDNPERIPKVSISVLNKFNPYMDYKNFMIPAYMVIVIILLGGFLPALNIVGEKEKGTIEQINITDIIYFRKADSILGYGTHSVVYLHVAGLGCIWVVAAWWHLDCLSVFPPFHIRTFWIWSNSFQLF